MGTENSENIFHIDWEPIGIRSECESGRTILEAARLAGISLTAACGGNGMCRACKVILRNGSLSSLTTIETNGLSESEIQSGVRLACQAKLCGNIRLDIPPSSLEGAQRLQLEGENISIDPDSAPVIRTVDITMKEPTIEDLLSDDRRLLTALSEKGFTNIQINPFVFKTISDILRKREWHVTVCLNANEVDAILPADQIPYGLAVDIGTTKIAAYLINLEQKKCAAKKGAMNPQIGYGEDVISRIAYTETTPNGRETLQQVLIETINTLIDTMCQESGCVSTQIVNAVMVCNTAIHHFFANLPVRQLGLYPFIPAVTNPLELYANSLGLHMADGARVYLPHNIAGYVGADHVAMHIGSDAWRPGKTRVAMDIGTNTEISVILPSGKMFSCSCASGPAFEGAHIHNGMRAAPGAIEDAQIIDQKLIYKTIDNAPAVGICGSGILDLVAALRKSGAINSHGQFNPDFPGVRPAKRNYEYVIVSEEESASGQPITVTRSDINEILLAKSAIRTGLDVLLLTAGIKETDIEEMIVAGAFGTYLKVSSAIAIGMFPNIPEERFQQVGNAAGTGAQKMLLSRAAREQSEQLIEKMTYVELTVHPAFKEILISSMKL